MRSFCFGQETNLVERKNLQTPGWSASSKNQKYKSIIARNRPTTESKKHKTSNTSFCLCSILRRSIESTVDYLNTLQKLNSFIQKVQLVVFNLLYNYTGEAKLLKNK